MKHGRALTIRLSAQQMEQLETICQNAGQSKTTCVRRLIVREWEHVREASTNHEETENGA